MKGGIVMALKTPINGTTGLLIKITGIFLTIGAIILGAGRVLNQASINTQDIASFKLKIPDIEKRVIIMETLIPEIKNQNERIEYKVDLLLMKNQIIFKR